MCSLLHFFQPIKGTVSRLKITAQEESSFLSLRVDSESQQTRFVSLYSQSRGNSNTWAASPLSP